MVAWALWLGLWMVGGLACGALIGVAAAEPVVRAAAGGGAGGMLLALLVETEGRARISSVSAVGTLRALLGDARRERWK